MSYPTNELSLKILVADAVVDRTNRFMIKGGNAPYWMAVSRSEEDLKKRLEEGWDVLLTSLYLGDWKNHMALVEPIVEAYKKKRLRVVLVYTPITDCGKEFMDAMSKHKIPARWYPYNYNNPSSHVALEL